MSIRNHRGPALLKSIQEKQIIEGGQSLSEGEFRKTNADTDVNITPLDQIERMQKQKVHDFQPDAPYDRGPGIP